jgi:hypothetical protein
VTAAEPQRGTIITRKLASCTHCFDLIFETGNGWRHNRTGSPDCGAAPGQQLPEIHRDVLDAP